MKRATVRRPGFPDLDILIVETVSAAVWPRSYFIVPKLRAAGFTRRQIERARKRLGVRLSGRSCDAVWRLRRVA